VNIQGDEFFNCVCRDGRIHLAKLDVYGSYSLCGKSIKHGKDLKNRVVCSGCEYTALKKYGIEFKAMIESQEQDI